MKHSIHHPESEAEYYPLDDDLPVWPTDEVQPILPYVNFRLRLHVGFCTKCRLDSGRTVAQVVSCGEGSTGGPA